MRKRTKVFIVFLGLAVIWTVYISSRSPTNDAKWQSQFQVLPSVELVNDTLYIKNVRDFRYAENDRVIQARYLNQEFKLSEFSGAWFGISHFGGHGLAHVFMSFEFNGDKFLAVSIEARLEEKHVDGYDPIKGLFRGYNKTVVLATEQDVIGLRTHIRGEPVNLYKLTIPELYSKPLLLNFLREAQVLTHTPAFYNTILDNCMTGLLAQSDQFRSFSSWMDRRILLPGGSDEIAYEKSIIDTSKSFSEVREASRIDPTSTDLEDGDFSKKIRL